MKYVYRPLGEAAENSSGGGTSAQIREVIVLGGLAALVLVGLYLLVALLSDHLLVRISPERERDLFSAYSDAFKGGPIPEPLKSKWATAESLFGELVEAAQLDGHSFSLGYIEMEQPNAFAVPGGAVVLTQGLLEAIESDAGLAFVLAHELGHFANRDHLRGLGRQIGFKVTLVLLFGADGGLSGSAADLLLLRQSRKQEAAADAYAIRLLEVVYEDTQGAGELFELLEAENELPAWAYMFSTHPDNLERLKAIRADQAKP